MPPKPHWPDHWHKPGGGIRCLASGCEFATYRGSLRDQYLELRDHCKEELGTEHDVLLHMLRQVWCVHAGCSHRRPAKEPSSIWALFDHETTAHDGAASMSHIASFVVLVREGRIEMKNMLSVHLIVFERLVEKLHAVDKPTLALIFWRGGAVDPADQTLEALRLILSPLSLRPAGWHPPYWQPIPSDQFLRNIEPTDEGPADELWEALWSRLRLMYAEGRI